MKFKKLFLSLFLLITASNQLSFAAQAPEEQGSKNPLVWIGKGLWATAKGVGSGLHSAAGVTKDIWNATMNENRFWALIFGSIVGGYACYSYNFSNFIEPIEKKYADKAKLCSWDGTKKDDLKKSQEGRAGWINHIQMRKDRINLIAKLNLTRVECADGEDHEKAQRLLETVKKEIEMIESDMNSLEHQFLIFFESAANFFRSLGCKPLGIKRAYNDKVGSKEFRNTGELLWSEAQFEEIDSYMIAQCSNKWWLVFPCFTANYHNAAKVWWDLKKKVFKLRLIEDSVLPIKDGQTYFSTYSYGNSHYSRNQVSIRKDIEPA